MVVAFLGCVSVFIFLFFSGRGVRYIVGVRNLKATGHGQ